jgi:CCR4-NOT transcription complex subunit 10
VGINLICQSNFGTSFRANYAGALQHINKLDNRSNDFKLAHNKALVEYCKSDFKKNETFQKNLTSICNQFRIRIDKLDDVDQCIIHYNQAILLYHQQQYTNAIFIMDRVYKFIEPMGNGNANKRIFYKRKNLQMTR